MTWPIVYLVSPEACVASIIIDSANTRRDDTSTFVPVNCLLIWLLGHMAGQSISHEDLGVHLVGSIVDDIVCCHQACASRPCPMRS